MLQDNRQYVLICPLDWGLGHASRMIPLVRRFIGEGYQVILGGSGKSGHLLKTTFPDLLFVTLPSPRILYAAHGRWLIWALFVQLPAIILSCVREHRFLQDIIKKHSVGIVVSDNRYGLFSKHAHCIFVTHQISPVLPVFLRWAEYPLCLFIRKLIHQFDECWIPDYPDPIMNLSGKLSHRYKKPRNARYVGILSRFKNKQDLHGEMIPDRYDVVFVLSGPEPQLGLLFRICLAWAEKSGMKILIISGYHDEKVVLNYKNSQIQVVPHLDPGSFKHVLESAGAVICRSGYSSIMDLITLGKTALLIPTPGQTEQEYLADYLSGKGLFRYVRQHELDDETIRNYINDPMIQDSGIAFPDSGEVSIPVPLNKKYR